MSLLPRNGILAFSAEAGVLSVYCGLVNRRAGKIAILGAGDGDTLALRWPADAR